MGILLLKSTIKNILKINEILGSFETIPRKKALKIMLLTSTSLRPKLNRLILILKIIFMSRFIFPKLQGKIFDDLQKKFSHARFQGNQ